MEFEEVWDGDGGEDGDDEYDDEEFDEGEGGFCGCVVHCVSFGLVEIMQMGRIGIIIIFLLFDLWFNFGCVSILLHDFWRIYAGFGDVCVNIGLNFMGRTLYRDGWGEAEIWWGFQDEGKSFFRLRLREWVSDVTHFQ